MTRYEYNELKDKLSSYDFDGKTLTKLSEELNVSVYSIRKALNELNIYIERTYNSNKSPQSERNVEIMQMFKDGKTFDFIGKKFGISRQRVHQIIRQENPTYREDFKKYKAQKNESVKYVGLRNYMVEHNMTKTDLYLLNRDSFPKYSDFCMQLKGTAPITISTINTILKITNMPYEKCFNVE